MQNKKWKFGPYFRVLIWGCYSYIVEFIHYATGNYFERGKYGYENFHVTKTPLFRLKVLKLLLFYLPSGFILLQDSYT